MNINGTYGFMKSTKSYQKKTLKELNEFLKKAKELNIRIITLRDKEKFSYNRDFEVCPLCGVKGNIFTSIHKNDCWLMEAHDLIYGLSKFDY